MFRSSSEQFWADYIVSEIVSMMSVHGLYKNGAYPVSGFAGIRQPAVIAANTLCTICQ